MKYTLEVRLEPARHYLHVSGQITQSARNTYYLNENFTILSTSCQGKEIAWNMDKEGARPPFDGISRPVTFAMEGETLDLEYEGYIPEIISDINQIDEDIVELAGYSGWYPKTGDSSDAFHV